MWFREEIVRWRDGLRTSHTGAEVIRAIAERMQAEPDPVKKRVVKFVLAEEHRAQGNKAAADALYREDPRDEVHYWYNDLLRTHEHDEIIEAIEERIHNNPDAPEVSDLYRMLASEHNFCGDYGASEAIYLRMFDEDPNDPMPLISLADQKLYWEERPEAAMPMIDRALEVAYRSGDFRRWALGTKARIALALKQYHVVEDVMRKILQLTISPDCVDIGRERDILRRLPPGSIDPEVARQYDEYCRAVGLTS
jgi:tetratricopeptide (TPR) repeat protein